MKKENYIIHFNFKNSKYYNYPFPHVVIDDFMSDEDFVKLQKNCKLISKKKDSKILLNSLELMEINNFFRLFVSSFLSQSNIKKLLNFFIEPIFQKYLIKVDSKFLSKLKLRKPKDFENQSNTIDFQFFSTNKENHSLTCHIDNNHELIAGLFYLTDSDNYLGALNFYQWKFFKFVYGKQRVPRFLCKKTNVFKLKKNRIILFMNSEDAIHSVNKWKFDGKSRDHFNFIINLNKKLFNKEYSNDFYQNHLINKIMRKIDKKEVF